MIHVADSSAWLEYFADSPQAVHFADAIEKPQHLRVPAITLYEVFKKIVQQRDEAVALQCIAVMQQSVVVSLDDSLALEAATLSLRHKLPMADSIVFATAVREHATLWTQDADFRGLPNVRYFERSV